MSNVAARFLKYVTFDTQSDPSCSSCPSTEKQKVFGSYLVEEMQGLGIKDAHMDESGYIYGTIPSNLSHEAPVFGFIAHMDTAGEISGKDVKARVVENYDGGDIVLNQEKNIVMSPKDFTHMKHYLGDSLIVTDGTTLLGADNKAGIAEILTMAETLLQNPSIPHGTIKIGFTPDEEIGRGADKFDVKGFGAEFAYTVDGGELGQITYENFNAAAANVTIHGVSIHPGSAKGKMVNALLLAMEFHSMLPTFENPAFTEEYEGFYHLGSLKGHVELAEMGYIIRDHDMEKYEEKKARFRKIADYLNEKYGAGTVEVDITDSYLNMKEKILPHLHIVETAKKAMEELSIEPVVSPIRGGTDGARLSYMGLPCPNLCTGGHNAHGRYEYIPIGSMEKVVEILLRIVKLYAEQ